jgi:hydrogenase-4 component E
MSLLARLVDLIAFATLVLALLVVWRQSLTARRRLFLAQSVALALAAAVVGVLGGKAELLVVAVAVLVLKAWVIPRLLREAAAGLPPRPTMVPVRPSLALLMAGALVVVAYVVMLPVAAASRLPTASAIPLAFAVILIGLLVCVTARRALSQVLGFLVFENGIFLFAVLTTYGVPAIVEAGVLLDVLVVALLLTGVVVQIRQEHDSIDLDRLRELRG